jgi:hypothetical protein
VLYVDSERSRDSNTSRFEGSFDGRILTISAPYGECVRGRCAHGKVRLLLSEDEVVALSAEVEARSLWTSISERDKTEWRSPYTKFEASLEVSDGTRSAESGIVYVQGRIDGERVKTGSPETHVRARDIHQLLMFMQTTAQRCYPDFKRS